MPINEAAAALPPFENAPQVAGNFLRRTIEDVLYNMATVALAWPLGMYLARVWKGERTWLDPVLRPVEGVLYKSFGVDPKRVR